MRQPERKLIPQRRLERREVECLIGKLSLNGGQREAKQAAVHDIQRGAVPGGDGHQHGGIEHRSGFQPAGEHLWLVDLHHPALLFLREAGRQEAKG